jgi:hypothetical protein
MVITCSPAYFWGVTFAAFAIGALAVHVAHRADRQRNAEHLSEALTLLSDCHAHIAVTTGPVAGVVILRRVRNLVARIQGGIASVQGPQS